VQRLNAALGFGLWALDLFSVTWFIPQNKNEPA